VGKAVPLEPYQTGSLDIVTHYVRHDLFLEEDELLRGADALANIPATLVQGRFDFTR
jgi:hypothetical protein